MSSLACQRDAFQMPRDYHYFNCAYMGPLPRAAEEAGFEAIRVLIPELGAPMPVRDHR